MTATYVVQQTMQKQLARFVAMYLVVVVSYTRENAHTVSVIISGVFR